MPWKLLWRNVTGHPVRSSLTIGAVAVAVFLITILQAVTSGLSRTLDASAANRLLVQSAVSLFVDLPLSYQAQSPALGMVLPSNSPGVHTLWLPVIPMQIGLVLKPGPQEPWTPYRMAKLDLPAP